MRKKILITGGSGLLGQYLNSALSEKFEILTLFHSQPGNCLLFPNRQFDLTDSAGLEQLFASFSPDIVIHTAAVSNPQKAMAADADSVYRINVAVTEQMAELCKNSGALLIYTSTDLVYAGYRGSLLTEQAKLAPKSLYAETKLMGEVKIQRIAPRYIILRTSLLVGMGIGHTSSSFEKMVVDLHRGKTVQVFTDQIRSPLVIEEAADIVLQLISAGVENETVNFAGNTRISRAGLAEIACEIAGFPESLLDKITMDKLTDIVPVEDVSLNVDKLKSFGITYKPFYSSLEREVTRIIEKAG